ncbi:hypothetical protein C6P46_004696 [Rhodotorula mucilaginosa]|uniref:Uncharacterized protein n=1 Tax=Rhodotorula mucilaginosa TaxID=5537 RepID=A0A9P6W0E4_RHOMI|nr:hypothetical protein C6P46_004696 [Rhodotorula mucilaginosa]
MICSQSARRSVPLSVRDIDVLGVTELLPWTLQSLATLRAFIHAEIHQCELTTVTFYDSGNASPKTLVLLPQGQGPPGNTTLSDVEAIGPLQVIDNITSSDSQIFAFFVEIAAGVSFDSYGFLPDGTGKNLDLPLDVLAPFPSATQCNVVSVGKPNAATQPTSTGDNTSSMSDSTGAAAAAATSTNLPASESFASAGARAPSSASAAASSARSTSSSASAAAASTSTTPSSGAAPVAAVGVGAAFMALGAAVVAAL